MENSLLTNLLQPCHNFFARPNFFYRLAFAAHGKIFAVHQNFRRQRPRVVGGRHHETVGARAQQREVIALADRISVLRDGTVIDTLERIAFEQTRLMLAMMSQHPERAAGPDDEQEGTGGVFGSLRSMFDFRRRRG